MILLTGAPGTGKTTLAHVAARHAGYTPREINASDDRSAAAITEAVRASFYAQMVTTRCLVPFLSRLVNRFKPRRFFRHRKLSPPYNPL